MKTDPNIFAAIFGLVGVIIGGLITAGSSFLIERRRDRIAAEQTEKREADEFMQAARLLEGELIRAEKATKCAISRKRWWPVESGPLEIDAWQRYRGIMALKLPYEDWQRVHMAFEFVQGINNGRAQSAREDTENPEWPTMPAEEWDRIPFGLSFITKGRVYLSQLIGANNKADADNITIMNWEAYAEKNSTTKFS